MLAASTDKLPAGATAIAAAVALADQIIRNLRRRTLRSHGLIGRVHARCAATLDVLCEVCTRCCPCGKMLCWTQFTLEQSQQLLLRQPGCTYHCCGLGVRQTPYRNSDSYRSHTVRQSRDRPTQDRLFFSRHLRFPRQPDKACLAAWARSAASYNAKKIERMGKFTKKTHSALR
jgi:hypothetical protein